MIDSATVNQPLLTRS